MSQKKYGSISNCKGQDESSQPAQPQPGGTVLGPSYYLKIISQHRLHKVEQMIPNSPIFLFLLSECMFSYLYIKHSKKCKKNNLAYHVERNVESNMNLTSLASSSGPFATICYRLTHTQRLCDFLFWMS